VVGPISSSPGLDRVLALAFGELPAAVSVIDMTGRVIYVNRANAEQLGRPAETIVGTPVADLLPAGARDAVGGMMADLLSSGQLRQILPNVQPDGSVIPVEVSARVVHDPSSGEPVCIVAIVRDLHDEVEELQELGDLAAAHADEGILPTLARVACRRTDAQVALVYVVGDDGRHKLVAAHGRSTASVQAAERWLVRTGVRETMIEHRDTVLRSPATSSGKPGGQSPRGSRRARAWLGVPLAISGQHLGFVCLIEKARGLDFELIDERRAGLYATHAAAAILEQRRLADLGASAVQLMRLAAAVDQTADSVLITDPKGRIIYVNAAFERVSGYPKEEALGQTPRLVNSGTHDRAFFRALWVTIKAGRPWTGELTNRRRDGSLYRLEAVITPVRDIGGRLVEYVEVGRDVTHERELEDTLARHIRERASIVATLQHIVPGDDPETTAAVICAEIARLPGIDAAAICLFSGRTTVTPLATVRPGEAPVKGGPPLAYAVGRYLQARARTGPWVEPWTLDQRAQSRVGRLEGVVAVAAHLPLLDAGEPVGLLVAGSTDPGGASGVVEALGSLGDFRPLTEALLRSHLRQRRDTMALQKRVEGVLRQRAFSTVFQPIADLVTGRRVGFEALTRFADGTEPRELIALAQEVGLDGDVELACVEAALQAAESLPSSAWVSLNLSPDVIRGPRLRELLGTSKRSLVVELTENFPIDDYVALRQSLRALGSRVRVAVDDAGAGYSSLRHVLELQPTFVKLDIRLVSDIDGDPARQAMVAGICHYARETRATLIAEGIETQAELDTLSRLGVRLGQGYLLGRPAPVDEIAGRRSRSARAVRAAPPDATQA
jgi:PAS domain S-box-containing protein